MRTYSFTVILDEPAATEEMADRLFEAGCDDSVPGSRHGVVQVGFDRQSETMEEAVTSAVRQIIAAGYSVNRVELDRAELQSLVAG
jgi:hypothetical protein